MSAFTVILPHKRNPGNDRALAVCLECLFANTVNDFTLLIDAAEDQPLYPRVNRMVKQAKTECCVYLASDTFLAPNWDTPMLEAWNENTFVTGVLVEPGAIAMHHLNLHKDFGRTPETFRRDQFEAWVASEAPVPSGRGWPCPYMLSKRGFLAHGGLQDAGLTPDQHGFTDADTRLWDAWEAAGNQIIRVRSFAYHLQRWSALDEQEHEKRQLQS